MQRHLRSLCTKIGQFNYIGNLIENIIFHNTQVFYAHTAKLTQNCQIRLKALFESTKTQILKVLNYNM
jgi:hypothetical protein